MGRPRTPIGTFGDITYVKVSGGRIRARTRYRDDDGQVRRVSATGAMNKEAERNLKKVLAQRPSHIATGELTGDSSFCQARRGLAGGPRLGEQSRTEYPGSLRAEHAPARHAGL